MRHLFVVGLARSGSTLLRHALNRSRDVTVLPETHFMKRSRALDLARRLAAEEPARMTETLYATDHMSRTGYWAWLRRTVPQTEFTRRLTLSDRSLQGLFALLIELYVERESEAGLPAVVGEKTPSHLHHVPTLVEWYPEAVVVHTFRDPRAVYASELRRRREGRWGLKQRLPWIPGAVTDAVLPAVEAIRTVLAWSAADRLDRRYRSRLGDRYLLVRFEDLVTAPDAELARVCERIGVPFTRALLDIDVVGSSYEADRHAGSGFDPAAVERWRRDVGPVARAWFRIFLGRRMHARGYHA